ncbi:M-phase phosphoprotein 6-like [Mizuhopecten yessoensis]|uniref:M-phase phosphoprotein 6 n=1 Tax=Mizuhopecten yessoensis TaxID=6573 RepID=A0A210PGM4_MIZYE|nr:M-phase phosphoprotein 6-like [Mizuhopecten yessoensis]OWF35620.1 M-phase phosphoprotein 6 [Mizuhopecten yessoensis]
MAGGPDQKTVLSKNVLQMKFMQRSALRIEKELNEEENKDIDDEHWVLDLPATQKLENNYMFEPSLVRIESLQFGRMSFCGFNPEIEKLMKRHNTKVELDAAEVKEMELSVQEDEMANRYQSLFGTIAKKFSSKRDRGQIEEKFSNSEENPPKSKKHRKFIKPADDD